MKLCTGLFFVLAFVATGVVHAVPGPVVAANGITWDAAPIVVDAQGGAANGTVKCKGKYSFAPGQELVDGSIAVAYIPQAGGAMVGTSAKGCGNDSWRWSSQAVFGGDSWRDVDAHRKHPRKLLPTECGTPHIGTI